MDSTPTKNNTRVTNEEISDWAFVKVMSEHLQTCLTEGRFSQIQVMLKENGFNVTLYNKNKNRTVDTKKRK